MLIEHKDLRYGRKTLSVDINVDKKTASVRFGTREPGWLFRRKPGETTIIFQQAELILQSKVQQLDYPIQLLFDTANSQLKLWARDKKDLLGFDSIEPNDLDAYRITVLKTYYP